jgi:hypothetical protein
LPPMMRMRQSVVSMNYLLSAQAAQRRASPARVLRSDTTRPLSPGTPLSSFSVSVGRRGRARTGRRAALIPAVAQMRYRMNRRNIRYSGP